jgi:hypothetical protein
MVCFVVALFSSTGLKTIYINNTMLCDMINEAAYKLFFTDICVPIPSLVHCENDITVLTKEGGSGAHIDNKKLYTWKAHPCIWITIYCDYTGTLALVHNNGDVCHLHPCFSLGKNCPIGTIFRAQIVFDRNSLDHTISPQIMIFDLLQWGSMSFTHMTPSSRYYKLRELTENIIFPTCIRIQWAGNGESAVEFCRTTLLPHDIECVLEYSEEEIYHMHPITCITKIIQDP